MNSIRHHEIQHRVANNMVTHTCDKCKRMFLSYSGLKKHKGKCKKGDDTPVVVNTGPPVNTATSNEIITRIDRIQHSINLLVDSYQDLIEQPSVVQETPVAQETSIKHTYITMKPRV